MKKITRIKLLIIILGIIFGFSSLFNTNFNNYDNLKGNNELKLKKAGYWEIGPIEIDDNDPTKNWTITAATYDWCNGSGTWKDPYIIEDVTIDGQDTHNCIRIDNSKVYFTIRNCTLINGVGEYWHSGGIRLENVTNGRIINNDCSFNQQGIYLIMSNNNTISGNTANNNTIYGIVLYDQCNDTKIIGNTANSNKGGLSIENSYNTLILGNNVSNNEGRGMDLRYIYDTEIINNTANNNGVLPSIGEGIAVQSSRNVTILFNHVQDNGFGMYINNDQDCKIFNNTAISNEDYGIQIERCTNVVVLKNNVSYSQSGIILRSESSDLRRNYNNTVSGNIVKDSSWGIYLYLTDNNTILENTLKDNDIGIFLRRSNHNNVSGNTLIGNDRCIIEQECEGNILQNNYCDIKPSISGYNVFLLIGAILITLIIATRKKKERAL